MKRTVWHEYDKNGEYVPRCSFCGRFKSKLHVHWFFTGVYCVSCVQDVLYDNARTIGEMK
jgi:ribosomal protein L34E